PEVHRDVMGREQEDMTSSLWLVLHQESGQEMYPQHRPVFQVKWLVCLTSKPRVQFVRGPIRSVRDLEAEFLIVVNLLYQLIVADRIGRPQNRMSTVEVYKCPL